MKFIIIIIYSIIIYMDIIKKILKNSYESINELTIEELEKVIKFANDKYRNTSTPVISDEIYDILIDFLKLKNPKSKLLKEIGCEVKSKDKVKLDYWLGSMDKMKPSNIKEFNKWINKYQKPYYISNKLDGISAMIIYRTNGNINLYTRGTATEGLDISPLLKYLKNIPSWEHVNSFVENKNISPIKKNIIFAARGELVMNKKIFEKNWSDKLKNGRNTVAGLVNSKKINPKLANDTSFVLYELIDPFLKYSDQMNILDDLNFDVVYYKEINNINFEILSQLLIKNKKESKYEIDGLIITDNNDHVRNTKGNPEYAFAFKDILEEQKAITKVISIEWNKSKDGYIKPVLIIEPVNIGGVEINRVTGNNAKFVVENKLGAGAEIELIRSGDVIPKVEQILKPSKNIKMPEGKWHWNETNVDIIFDDLKDKDILIKNIAYFFSSLDTKGLGSKIVEKLVNAGYDSILKIIKLSSKNIIEIEGFQEKSANNLTESIKKSLTDISLSKLMSASNKLGHTIGEERIKLILNKYPNLLIDAEEWSKNDFINNLKKINGWEEKNSTLFVNNFNEFKKFYNSIKSYITIKKIEKIIIVKNKYTDKIIVLSGFRDNELQKKLEECGAKITNSISKNTDYLIVKDQNTIDENTSKVEKAIELGITIITKDNVF